MTNRTKIIFLALWLGFMAGGCSTEMLSHGAYETMRNVSNAQNADDPFYDPDQIDDYNQYKAKREGYIQDQNDSKQ